MRIQRGDKNLVLVILQRAQNPIESYINRFLPLFWPGFGHSDMVKAKTVWHDSLFVMLPVFPAPGCIVTLLDLGRK